MKISFIKTACHIALSFLLFISGCGDNRANKNGFSSIGEFSVRKIDNNCKEIRDGAGRVLILVPRGAAPPKGYDKKQIIRVPVKRVVACSGYNVALLKALGVLEKVLVGVTKKEKEWTIPQVRQGMKKGRISFIGDAGAVDYERLKAAEPELLLTWDIQAIPVMDQMGIITVITTTGDAMSLDTRMKFAKFLALFFAREKEADAYVAKVTKAIDKVRAMNSCPQKESKVIWGDIYEKRVLVEPGGSWAAEMVTLAGGKYLFTDIRGGS